MTDLTSLPTPASSSSGPRTSILWPLGSGLLLTGLGVLFLLVTTLFQGSNWWAVFIFIPAVGMLWGAWLASHFSRGAFNLWVRLNLGCGLITLAVALIFALGLDWGIAWPLMLVVPGLVIFLNGFTHPRLRFGSPLGSAANMQFWLGTSVVLLGVIFLLNQLGLLNLIAQFGKFPWWSVFILIPGVGALLNALAVHRANGPHAAADSLLVLGVMLCMDAAAEYLTLPWQWRAPLALTLGGLAIIALGFRRQ